MVDEEFYREIEERAKKADRDRRETARRARDQFQRNTIELNVCFDTDLPSADTPIMRESCNEKHIPIEVIETDRKPMPVVETQRS